MITLGDQIEKITPSEHLPADHVSTKMASHQYGVKENPFTVNKGSVGLAPPRFCFEKKKKHSSSLPCSALDVTEAKQEMYSSEVKPSKDFGSAEHL